ncbi:HEAT repeat domain-containing protein [Sphaerospermopsis kisseleviana CS-549]|uniref:HEAT repeat domain-containing protein n=1 Tax=Sphaerospermopsis kisseleviana CS-549 TaxID=3021783 RepID=A0ABT4ZXY1_9CYAN|nr:HEAT repeat domain-containing protein [Sphaerospermopsis kisseleviana]MDB9443527.1 HEAT repeat domain-containing protein [Sphaerospermopsis kisseleviana CS-549]
MLAERQKLTTNPLTHAEGVNFRVQDVYVPLGLVERKKQPKQKSNLDISPERGSELYQETEITQKYENNEFLEQVFHQKNTPKSQGKRIAIIGEPGAGKTTLLQQIANYLSHQNTDAIIIWISLAELENQTLQDYVFTTWLNAASQQANKAAADQNIKDDLTSQFNNGKVWLLLDGLDEMVVTSGNPLGYINQAICQGGIITQARIVLTCRVNLWDGQSNALSDFDTYRTLDFSYPEQVELFINNWFIAEPKRGESLFNDLRKPGKERIQDLVKNPLRLTLLCFNWQQKTGSLPDTQAGLYQQFVDDFDKWKQELFNQNVGDKLDTLKDKLAELAKVAIDKEATRFRLSENLVNEYLGKNNDQNSLLSLALKLGWLNQVGRDPNGNPTYAFFHASFQEYFAATAIDDWDFFLPRNHKNNPIENKQYRIFDPQWKQTILLWFGSKDVDKAQKEAFIQALINFQDGCAKYQGKSFYGYRAYFLAAAAITEFKNCDRADAIVKQIVDWKFGNFDTIREQVTTALQETERTKAIAALVQVIQTSQDEYTRWQAAESLGKIGHGNEQAIAALVQLIQTSQDESTRRRAAESLGNIGHGNEQAIAALVQVIQTSQDEYTLQQAAESLGKIGHGNEQAIAALVQLIQTSQSEYTRRRAAESLGKIDPGNEQAIAALVQVIQTSQDYFTRWQAAESLGNIGHGNEKAIAALVQLIQTSQSEYTRQQAAESLGNIGHGNEKVIAALVQLIQTSQDESTRWQAADSLGKIVNSNQARSLLIQTLSSYMLNNKSYELIWKCAQNMPYPEFYQAGYQPFLGTRLVRSLKSILFMRIF